jgi:hypothetical protein
MRKIHALHGACRTGMHLRFDTIVLQLMRHRLAYRGNRRTVCSQHLAGHCRDILYSLESSVTNIVAPVLKAPDEPHGAPSGRK